MTFRVGDEVEVTIPTWAGDRVGIVIHVEPTGEHHVEIRYPVSTFVYRWILAKDLQLVRLASPGPPTDPGADEYMEIMRCQEAGNLR